MYLPTPGISNYTEVKIENQEGLRNRKFPKYFTVIQGNDTLFITMPANKKLLVADDSLTIQKVIRLALSNEGYEIQTVSDGNDAIQQISLFRPDAVLVDVSLPGRNAIEVKKAINEQGDFDEVRFILMSSAFEKVDEAQVAEANFHSRLTKPFDPANLRKVLSDVLSEVVAKRLEATSLIEKSSLEQPTSVPSELEPEELPEELMDPIKPEEDVIAPQKSEAISSLWESDASANETPDSDIKHLTESTIRLSGLDDFQWSVNENAKKSDPTTSAPESFSDNGATSFKIDPPSEDFASTLPPFYPDVADEVKQANKNSAQADNAYHSAPEELPNSFSEPLLQPPPAPISMQPERPSAEATVMALSNTQIEEMLQKQIQNSFEKMVHKIMPEIAERVIKQEINRLLNEL